MKRALIPLPDRDFDVTEVAVPWKLLTRAGHRVVFSTEQGGTAPAADPLLLTGVLFGQLGAEPERFEGFEFEHLFLQPMDGPEREKNVQDATKYCLEHPRWRLSIQTHKLIGIP